MVATLGSPCDGGAQTLRKSPLPAPPPGVIFQSLQARGLHIWGSKPGDIWSVGLQGAVGHWNGSGFSPVESGVKEHLQSIWGSGPTDIWVVGNTQSAHWDGKRFSPVPSAAGYFLNDVWGAAPGDVWAVGSDAVVLHLVKGTFVRARLPEAVDPHCRLTGVWGSSARDVWVVGTEGTVLHWDGAQWKIVTAGVSINLNAIWGSGAEDIWMVGESRSILHWNGKGFQVVNAGHMYDLYGVWGSARNNVWMVGAGYSIYHWNGTSLIPILRQDGNEHKDLLWSVWGSGANDVWIPTAQETVLRYLGQQSLHPPAAAAPTPCQPGATRCSNRQILACDAKGKAWGLIGDCPAGCQADDCPEQCRPYLERRTASGTVQCDPSGKKWVALQPPATLGGGKAPGQDGLIKVNTDANGNALLGGIPVSTNLWDCAMDVGGGGAGHHQVSMSALDTCPTKKDTGVSADELASWKKLYLQRVKK